MTDPRTALEDAFKVTRYCLTPIGVERPGPDYIRVEDHQGTILVDERMGPDGPFRPPSAEIARQRPWFFTGSPFGREIIALAAACIKAKEAGDGR